jgi:hypothetical protein
MSTYEGEHTIFGLLTAQHLYSTYLVWPVSSSHPHTCFSSIIAKDIEEKKEKIHEKCIKYGKT